MEMIFFLFPPPDWGDHLHAAGVLHQGAAGFDAGCSAEMGEPSAEGITCSNKGRLQCLCSLSPGQEWQSV